MKFTWRYTIQCLFLFFVTLMATPAGANEISLASPNGAIFVKLNASQELNKLLHYTLSYNAQMGLSGSVIGVQMAGLQNIAMKLIHVKKHSVSTIWKPVYGERNLIPDKYNQLNFYFRSVTDNSFTIHITCRAYNEGFAYRYEIFHKGNLIKLNTELSQFQLPQNVSAWTSNAAQDVLIERKVNSITDIIERPVTLKQNDRFYMALGEAGLVDFARMKFTGNGSNGLVTRLSGEVVSRDQLTSPWRYVLVGGSPGDLLEKNYFLLNLNEPCQIKDTKWIKPGKVLREVTLTTQGSYNCIDFAAGHGIKYICFDAGWYGKEDSDTSDATRVALDPARSKGPLDLKKVIAYGKQKGVGVILYVNRRALERQLDTLLPLYQSWGVEGLKFGFVQVGSQQWTSWLHGAIRKAADYKMVVDVHDEYRPTGYNRTYPNLLTQEGIRGDEESPKTEHSITTLFTRMIAGPADNTNCYFTDRVNKMSSHVAQMAKAICIYSPLQFLYWYDRPVPDNQRKGKEGEINEVPELAWYNSLPTVWDDTKVLESDMEAFATIARKSRDSWFIGSLNGKASRKAVLSCRFLDKNKKYTAIIYTDDNSMKTATNVRISIMEVDQRSVLSFTIAERNGVAVHIFPKSI